MEKESSQTSRSVAVLIIVVTLIAVSVTIPTKWLGGVSQKKLRDPIDLSSLSSGGIAINSNNNGNVTWSDVVMSTLNPSSSTLEELKKIPVDQKEITDLNDPNNLTSSFTKNVYLASTYLTQNGTTLDEQGQQDIITKLMQEEKDKIVPTVYSYKDINVAKTESKESIRIYGNALATIMENIITKKSAADDMTSIQNYLKSENVSDLTPLINNKKKLDSIVKKLLALSVPPSAVIFHIIALNKITAFKDVITSLSNADKDPMRATLVLGSYVDTSITSLRVFGQFTSYFNTQNITFSSKEKGYVFTVGYNPTN